MGIFDKFKRDAKEKKEAKADFSRVESGGSSTAAPAEKASAGTTTYTVVAGDSLWKISEKFYGDGNQWRRIYEANKDTIKDPDVIHPGQTFAIPAKEEGR